MLALTENSRRSLMTKCLVGCALLSVSLCIVMLMGCGEEGLDPDATVVSAPRTEIQVNPNSQSPVLTPFTSLESPPTATSWPTLPPATSDKGAPAVATLPPTTVKPAVKPPPVADQTPSTTPEQKVSSQEIAARVPTMQPRSEPAPTTQPAATPLPAGTQMPVSPPFPTEVPTPVPTATTVPTPTPLPPGLSLDDPVEAGGVLKGPDGAEIVVTAIDEDAFRPHRRAREEGNRFYLISVGFANISGEGLVYADAFVFRLIGDLGTVYYPYEDANSCGSGFPNRLYGGLYPGGKLEGNLCFEVPPSEDNFALIYSPGGSLAQAWYYLRLDPRQLGSLDDLAEVSLAPTPNSLALPRGTRVDNPVEAGSVLKGTDGWEVVVTGFSDDGYDEFLHKMQLETGNPVFDPSGRGLKYYRVDLGVANFSGKDFLTLHRPGFRLVGNSRLLYYGGTCTHVQDGLNADPTADEISAGDLCFAVPATESGFILIYVPEANNPESWRFLELDPHRVGSLYDFTGAPVPLTTPSSESLASRGSGFTSVSTAYGHACGLRANGIILCWGRGRQGETDPVEATYTAVSLGDGYSCGLKTDGLITCWGVWGISYGMTGANTFREPESPYGLFKSLSAGSSHACGIRIDNTLACWGENYVSAGDFAEYAGQATPPSGTFLSVSAGAGHTCGVTTDNRVVCWGARYEGSTSPAEGNFLSVSAGSSFSCGVRADFTLTCWGSSVYGDMTPPAGKFSSVAASHISACGVRSSGEVECWGYHLKNVPPQGKFLSISAADAHRCAVRIDGYIVCWGHDFSFGQLGLQTNVICGVLPNRTVVCPGDENYNLLASVHASDWVNYYYHNGSVYPCGDGPDGAEMCWDPYEDAFVEPTAREVVEFSAGDGSACWLLPDLTVGCWGGAVFGSPQGAFRSVDVGDAIYRSFACGVRTNGELACWGGNGHDAGNVFPPKGTFKSVSPGYIHGCAIRMDDTVACWGAIGEKYGGRGVPPSGSFRALGGGGGGGQCGIRPDNTLDCWGGLEALPGTFQSVSVGFSRHGDFYCGVRTNGTLACSGINRYGETKPPPGRFKSVSAGWRHACGVRTNGTVACWGSNTDYWDEVLGQVDPPEGRFLSASAGHNYSCGIRTDHTLACWGRVPEVLQNLSGLYPP